jgi:uridine kinase
MRAALLISGYLRSFKLNLPVIREKILNKFDNVDVYIHLTKNESKTDRYINDVNELKDIEYINNILSPVALIQEDNLKKYNDDSKNNLFNLWLKYYKLNELKKINETIFGTYDVVIKYRPDLNIITDNAFVGNIEHDTVYIPKESVIDSSKLTKQDDKSICDIFSYGTSHIMNRYFEIYKNIDELCQEHGTVSETILYHYLNDTNIKYQLLDIDYNVILSTCNVFAICGDSGSGKTMLSNILKKYFSSSFTLECDRYHKWERKDENWNKFTHLNPEANYLTKMNKDIFDLKIGKEVHQVNYDHKSGKFTEKQQIEKADNVIVCGLHSLYTDNEHVYNLKIFVDTDINLKTRWKIQRDTSKRGYSIDETLKQIEKRQNDFIKFVYPQRAYSDIVINFFTDREFNVQELDNNPNIFLRILVNKKHSLIEILSQLSNNNIQHDVDCSADDTFNIVTFYSFTQSNILKPYSISFNSYYDYIMFFILSLHS